tara:strand:+ start:867 stop:2480 length:1614 start_codon:yes stop_codon:yes gene_type:complete
MADAIYRPDVVIVGGGVAGLTTALNLAPRKVCIITKSTLGVNTSSMWAQGGIAAAVGINDSVKSHIEDTVATAKGLADENVIVKVVSDAENIISDLESFGVNFDKNDDGSFDLGLEAAHSSNRIVRSKGDSSGIEIMRGLIEKVRESHNITVLENVSIDSIMSENNTIHGVIGRLVQDNVPDNHVVIESSNVVLATGGLGGIFANTTNPRSSYGEGIALAAQAGAVLTDMEFIQFHPTGLDFGLDPTPLATEAIRGDGAYLVNQNEERFMLGIHPENELAPRDLVAQNLFKQIEKGNSVFLDCRKISNEFETKYPQVASYCQAAGLNPKIDLLPILPVAHYHIGGVKTDLEGKTSIEGLWCCGEVAATGIHGANRLASNSLLESMVFGRIVAKNINSLPIKKVNKINPDFIRMHKEKTKNRIRAKKYIWQLRSSMMRNIGIVRNHSSIIRGLHDILKIERESKGLSAKLNDMILVSKFIIIGAYLRKESRGCHLRSDYKNTEDNFIMHFDLKFSDLDSKITEILNMAHNANHKKVVN